MLGKYSTTSNTRPATTHIYAMRTYFYPWQTSTANVTKPFLRKPAQPVRLNIGALQNQPSCFHTSRFKSIRSIHCQRPLQKHVNNHMDIVNGVTFVTRERMSPQGPIFCIVIAIMVTVDIAVAVCLVTTPIVVVIVTVCEGEILKIIVDRIFVTGSLLLWLCCCFCIWCVP